MVVYTVRIGPLAVESLKEIQQYLAENVSVEIADKIVDGILEIIQRLEKFPAAHEADHLLNDKSSSTYRRTFYKDYRIVFTIDEEAVSVEVVDVLHTSRGARTRISRIVV